MDRDRLWLWLSYSALAAFALFFLIRPFLDPADAYRPRLIPGVTYAYSYLVVAAFVPYTVAAWASREGISFRKAAIAGCVLHLIVLFAPLTQSQDLYAYLFYGKTWAVHGANPYTVVPQTFAADPWFPWMQWADQPSVYGPLWTMLSGGVAKLSGGSIAVAYAAMKVAMLAFGIGATLGMARASESRGVSAGRNVLLALWNPLIIVSLPLGGHADVAVVAAIVWALVADRRGHPLLAALALTAAWLVKAYAVVVLGVYLLALLRRSLSIAARGSAVAAGVTALAWLPFWQGPSTLEALGDVAGQPSASLAGQLQLALSGLVSEDAASVVVRVTGIAVVAGVLFVLARRPGFAADPWPAAAATFLAYIAVTPWFLYWHLSGPLALALVAASPPLRAGALTFSGTAMLTSSFGSTWWGRVTQTSLRYGIPALAGLRAARRQATGGRPPRWRPPRRSSA